MIKILLTMIDIFWISYVNNFKWKSNINYACMKFIRQQLWERTKQFVINGDKIDINNSETELPVVFVAFWGDTYS